MPQSRPSGHTYRVGNVGYLCRNSSTIPHAYSLHG